MSELLNDPGHYREDLRLIEQSVNRSIKCPEIPIPEAIIDAMPKVAGTILLKGNAREQLRAGALLLAFMEYNKSLNTESRSGTTVNVGVNVDNRSDSSRALELIERFRSGQISGRTDDGGVQDIREGVEG